MKKSRDDYLTVLLIAVTAIYMLIALAFPMYAILSKGLQNNIKKNNSISISLQPAALKVINK